MQTVDVLNNATQTIEINRIHFATRTPGKEFSPVPFVCGSGDTILQPLFWES